MPDPLQALPSEIWTQCLELALYGRAAGPLELMMVSRAWDTFILESSLLWRYIYIRNEEDEMARIQTFLKLSGRCPLEVDITTVLPEVDALHLLEPHLARIQTVSIRPSIPHPITVSYSEQWRRTVAYILSQFSQNLQPMDVADTLCTGGFFRDIHPWQYHVSALRLKMAYLETKNCQDTSNGHATRSQLPKHFRVWEEHIAKTIKTFQTDPLDLTNQVITRDKRYTIKENNITVLQGLLNGKLVAVKIFKASPTQDPDLYLYCKRLALTERHVWATLKHKNISEFLGYSNEFCDFPATVSTWYQHGTASEYLNHRQILIDERLRLAQDIGEGLQYLHQLKVIHGDVNLSNVLIDDMGVGRLCDFTLSSLIGWPGAEEIAAVPREIFQDTVASESDTTPEGRRHDVSFDDDIYFLGSTILEVIERIQPFQRLKGSDVYVPQRTVVIGAPPALRSETTNAMKHLTGQFWDLLEACWEETPSRLVIGTVVERLDSMAYNLSFTP